MDNRLEEDVFEGEGEEDISEEGEDDIMGSEEEDDDEDIMESESESEGEEEEEAEQLEEMRAPVATSWMGVDGVTVHGILVIDDGIFRLKNRCQFDHCSICYQPPSTGKHHQVCCLPCGHMYGFSCIKKWLLQSSSSGKCPQCNTACSFEDAILLYPPRPCVTAHQKASSAALFPFTKQGYLEFKKYEFSRMVDARLLGTDDERHMNILVTQHNNLADRLNKLISKWDNLLTRAEELEKRAESLGLADALRKRADALRKRADALGPQIEALGRRADALERLVSALRRRVDALKQRCDAYDSRMTFYIQMYKEHHKIIKKN